MQATPLVVVIGASIFNKKLIIRWLAVGLSFLGVLMIVRPEEAGLLAVAFGNIWYVGFAFEFGSRAASPKLNILHLVAMILSLYCGTF